MLVKTQHKLIAAYGGVEPPCSKQSRFLEGHIVWSAPPIEATV